MERQRAGEQLTAEEQAYLRRAREAKQGGSAEAKGRAAGQRPAPARLVPLTDFGQGEKYEGRDGGLYGQGRNTPPESQLARATQALEAIRPLDDKGESSPQGVIGFVSLSMSNATQEFARFKQLADADPAKSRQVVIVDCAQGGAAMAEWAPPDGVPWKVTRERLAAARVSPRQAQAAWVKLANKGPEGPFARHTEKLERDTIALLRNARALFPNLRVVYLGSRTYGGYASGPLNPEPYAYETAFAARRLIERQIAGDPDLVAPSLPVLLWGPYLWADGTRGRAAGDLIWLREDFSADGVHPSASGREKVARLLLAFFSGDALARPWFTAP
jgi:hypothetical protein